MYRTKKERIKEVVFIILGIGALGAMFLLSRSRGLSYHDDSISLKEGIWILFLLLGSTWIYSLTNKLRDIEDRVTKIEKKNISNK